MWEAGWAAGADPLGVIADTYAGEYGIPDATLDQWFGGPGEGGLGSAALKSVTEAGDAVLRTASLPFALGADAIASLTSDDPEKVAEQRHALLSLPPFPGEMPPAAGIAREAVVGRALDSGLSGAIPRRAAATVAGMRRPPDGITVAQIGTGDFGPIYRHPGSWADVVKGLTQVGMGEGSGSPQPSGDFRSDRRGLGHTGQRPWRRIRPFEACPLIIQRCCGTSPSYFNRCR